MLRNDDFSVPSAMLSTSMNMKVALMEKAQLSQLVPSNFLIVESSLEVAESAMM